MNEQELSIYIQNLHDAEFALSGSLIKVSDEEKNTARRARRSLYASRDIRRGEAIKPDDILVVRPEGFLAADCIDQIVGKPINVNLKRYEPFKWEYFI
jgi:sialic acid synthase SpsE